MPSDILPRNKNLLEYARKLRKNATKEENLLWYDFLRKYPIRFYRQRIIGNYIADFYCHRAKLVIEIDGCQHYEEQAINYDNNRTQYFESLGLSVLRFANGDVRKNFRTVCNIIEKEVFRRIP